MIFFSGHKAPSLIKYQDIEERSSLEEDWHGYYSALLCLLDSVIICKEVRERGVVSGKNNIFLTIFMSLIVTIGIVYLYLPTSFIELHSAGRVILQPHATVFIVLIGFLFISLLIDRKLKAATQTIPIYSGQMRFQSSPQTESTQHINLIHQLAGTADEKLPLPNINIHDHTQQAGKIKVIPQSTITHFSLFPHTALIHMARRAEQNFSFSPGFISVLLARGPPNPT
jgi:hypothetical protein